MIIKKLLFFVTAILSLLFIACDDKMNTLGGSIQPGGDSVEVGADTVQIKARTISLKDSIYARTISGSLGEYHDPIFGKIKSDYLCEFFSSEKTTIHNRAFAIDSVQFVFMASGFYGDTVSPMGISVYKLNKKLEKDFFTNIDPSKYCDLSHLMARGMFVVQDIPSSGKIVANADTLLGHQFLERWKQDSTVFKSPEALKKFFPGAYVTTTFGSGTLVNVKYTLFDIHYKYVGRNKGNTADSIMTDYFRISVTPEVIQMNHIENSIPSDILAENSQKSYLKTPAGVCTELTIPLKEIIKKAGDKNIINSAVLKIKGMTEEEELSGLPRPSMLLLVNKDSLSNFFVDKKQPDDLTSYILWNTNNFSSLTSLKNTYMYIRKIPASSSYVADGNISNLINHYVNYYKDRDDVKDLTYLIFPIEMSSTNSNIYHLMSPSSAILRTDKENMLMPLVFSKFNNR